MIARAALALCLLAAFGCGAGIAPAFDARFADNDAADLARVRAQLADAAKTPRADDAALLLATSHGAQPELIAYDLGAQRARWRTPFHAESRPELLGDAVVSAAGGRLHAFDAATGRARFSAALDGGAYLGAARDGERIVFACQNAGRTSLEARARLTALDAGSGRVLWQRDAQGLLGRPAAAGGLVFAPWRRQSLAVLDARDGTEVARLRATDDVIDWVTADGGTVLFGHNGAHRFGASGAREVERGAALIARDALPGRPPLAPSAFDPEPGTRSARGRVALYFEPEVSAADGVRVAHDSYYAVFYRYVFAYDTSGRMRWARVLPHDAVAGRARPEGLVVVTERGQALLLPAADGEPSVLGDLGVQLASARIAAVKLRAPTAPPAPRPLRQSLTEIALDTDNRLVPARAYAVAQLAAMDEPEVTRDLLDIYAQTATAPELKRAVADALRTRRTGLEHLIDALLVRYDFIEQTRPAPLAVIVPALVDARETRAVPNLVQRMFDHETPLAQLPRLVAAVAALGGEQAVEPLLSFLRLYRADSSLSAQPEALIEAARGVHAHGGESGAAALAALNADGRANPALGSALAALLAPPAAAAQPVEAVAAAAPAPPVPEALTQDAVNAAFAEHADDLRACIIDELGRNPELAQVRIAFVAENDGSAHAFSFVPNTPAFVDCLYPKLAGYTFPRFRAGREVAKYVIAVRARAPSALPAESLGEAPWWQWYAKRAPARATAAGKAQPWWRSQQPLAPLSLTAKSVGPDDSPAQPSTPAAAPAQAVAPGRAAPNAAGPAPAATPAGAVPNAPAPQPAAPAPAGAEQAPAEDAWWVPAAPK